MNTIMMTNKEIAQTFENTSMFESDKFDAIKQIGFSNNEATGKLPQQNPNQPILLNLGCGLDVREGFINIDLFSDNPNVVKMDIRKLNFPDNYADLILASDILEHFSHRQTSMILAEWSRVLKPNATIIIRCPSLKLQVKAYSENKWNADIASYMIFGGQTNPGDYHCIAFDETSIKQHLEKAGLKVVEFEEVDTPQDKGYINLNMTVKAVKVAPNYQNTNNSNDINNKINNQANNKDNSNSHCSYSSDDVSDKNSYCSYGSNENNLSSSNSNVTSKENTNTSKNINFNNKINKSNNNSNSNNISQSDNISTNANIITANSNPNSITIPNSNMNTNVNIVPVEGKSLNIVWEGSQFVYHSLALINREHCKNLIDANIANVTIIPYETDEFTAEINPSYKKLQENDIRFKADVSEEISNLPYAWVRHQWPPKAEKPQGAKWIIIQPWEFSNFPKRFVDIFEQTDEIWTPSNFSRQAFINSGIEANKVQVIPNGIDPELFKPNGDKYKLATEKLFKFLYVGGTTYRKGFDILLRAYLQTFNKDDEVCLVVKDMGVDTFYKGQTAQELIAQAQLNPNAPEIIYIKDSLTDEQMASLYRACDMFVSPYRGEGFSIPTLEAMASGLPVIVTKGGATDDFTYDQNAWYINSELKLFEQNQNNVNPNSNNNIIDNETYLLEPDYAELVETLDFVARNPENNFSMGLIGYYVSKNWTWKHSTMKILNRLDFLYNTEMSKTAAEILTDKEDDFSLIAAAELAFINEDYEQAERLFVYFLEYTNLQNGTDADNTNINNNNIDDSNIDRSINKPQNYINDKYIVHSLNRLAQIEIGKRNLISAYKYSEAAVTIMPNNPDAVWLSAVILSAEEKYVEALETLTPIVDDWKKSKYLSTVGIDLEKHLLFMADTLFQMGDLEKAAQIYEATLKSNNFSAEACYGLGMCYKEAELFDDAKNMFEWAIKYQPDYENAINELNSLKNN